MFKSTAFGLTLIAAGWLADALASRDRDIEAGVAAYEAGEYEQALEHFATAQESRGERPEIAYDRGLVELATEAVSDESFRRATESDNVDVKASAHLALGNRAFATEQWDQAIAEYKDCLRTRPDHHPAKWNLELALQRKKEAEEEEEEEEETGDDHNTGEDGETGQEDPTGEEQPSGTGDEGDSGEDEPTDAGGESGEDEATGADRSPQTGEDGGQSGEQPSDPDESESPQQTGGSESPPSDEPPPADPGAAPIEQLDLDRALEQLDEEDQFLFGQPRGRNVPVEKDW
ncbi:MAG: hypothetical protein B7733_07990 [Myxococcales bacterium FL481]|nr:MAG: hypothetical protein B7733_07990 [Myxococcales bacterium FL481]